MQRIASPTPSNNGVFFLLGDHLCRTCKVTSAAGQEAGELRYKAFGEACPSSGTVTTDYRYTGQREETAIGLYYYNARWYDPALGRFIQADTVTSGSDGMAWERYGYVRDNPMRYIDPSGHDVGCSAANPACAESNGITRHAQKDIEDAITNWRRSGASPSKSNVALPTTIPAPLRPPTPDFDCLANPSLARCGTSTPVVVVSAPPTEEVVIRPFFPTPTMGPEDWAPALDCWDIRGGGQCALSQAIEMAPPIQPIDPITAIYEGGRQILVLLDRGMTGFVSWGREIFGDSFPFGLDS